MSDVFGSDFFKGNRERLKQLFTGTAPIVVTANGRMQKIADEAFTFRQDSNFWYLTGIDEPNIVLVMDKDREYLIIPERGDWEEASEGVLDADELGRRSGVDTVLQEKEGWKQLGSRMKRVRHVATLSPPPPYVEVFGMYTNPARTALIKKLKDINGEVELLDLRQHLMHMRMIKQPVEIEALRRAIGVTVDTLKHVLKPERLAKYRYEYEVEADVSYGFRMRGAQEHSFDPVVSAGERACTVHNAASSVPISGDELLTVDVGARVEYYCADLARTVSLSGKPSRRQQAVWRAVCEAQDYAYSLLKPGAMLREYEKQMEQFIGEKLRELGLIKTISTEAVRGGGFFPHATSHHLGIDAHDFGDYDSQLEPGMVLAVEPGIYIKEEGIGVRIEDDVLITDDGCEILSKRLPRELV